MIFIVGHHNAGKTTLAKYLENYHFQHVETGKVIRKKHRNSASEMNFYKWVEKHQHEFDHDITTKIREVKNEILESNKTIQDIIITGNRQINGIHYIIKRVSPFKEKAAIIVFLKADKATLFHRQITRSDRNSEGLTFEKFCNEILAYDSAMGVDEIEQQATRVFVNEDSPEAIQRKVVAFLKSYGYQFAPHQFIPTSESKAAAQNEPGNL